MLILIPILIFSLLITFIFSIITFPILFSLYIYSLLLEAVVAQWYRKGQGTS